MSRHPSYGKSAKGATKRNVLKRFERIKAMKKKNQWTEEKGVFHLPKLKSTN